MRKIIFVLLIFSLFMILIIGCSDQNSDIVDDRIVELGNEINKPSIKENVDLDNTSNCVNMDSTTITPMETQSLDNVIPVSVKTFFEEKLLWLLCCTKDDYFSVSSSFAYYSEKFGQNIIVSGINKNPGMPVNRQKKFSGLYAGSVKYAIDMYDEGINRYEIDLKNMIELNRVNKESDYVAAFTVYNPEMLEISSISLQELNINEKIYLVSAGDYAMTGYDMFECTIGDVYEKSFTFSTEYNPFCDDKSGGILLNSNGEIIGIHVLNEEGMSIGYKIKYVIESIEDGVMLENEYIPNYDPYAVDEHRYNEYGVYQINSEMVKQAPWKEIYVYSVEFANEIEGKKAPQNNRFAVFEVKIQYYVDISSFRLGKDKEFLPYNEVLFDDQFIPKELDVKENSIWPEKIGKVVFVVPDDMDFSCVFSYESYRLDF